jgi:hypothetical protein
MSGLFTGLSNRILQPERTCRSRTDVGEQTDTPGREIHLELRRRAQSRMLWVPKTRAPRNRFTATHCNRAPARVLGTDNHAPAVLLSPEKESILA